MSLMNTKVGMRYLCNIERDSNAATLDSWGGSNSPMWVPLSTVPCSAWTSSGRESLTTNRSAVVEDRRASVPLSTDVTEQDRVSSVTTESGAIHFDGPMSIGSAMKYSDHIELVLERVR